MEIGTRESLLSVFYPEQFTLEKLEEAETSEKFHYIIHDSAYKDVKRRLSGIGEHPKQRIIILDDLEKAFRQYFPNKAMDEIEFQKWHRALSSKICDDFKEIINALQKHKQPVYASFEVDNLFYLYFGWHPDGVGTHFRYGCEKIPVYIYFNRYYVNTLDHRLPLYRRRNDVNSIFRLGSRDHFKSLSFFGKLSWDSERKMIDAVPLIITNMQL